MNNLENTVIHCNQLTKIFGKADNQVLALNQVDLSVAPGEIIGLVGPNGAGKTTILSILAGLIYPTNGQAFICGEPPRSVAAKSRLGYAGEFPYFLANYKPADVLDYHGALLGMSRKNRKAEADRLINELGITEYANRRCGVLSQGLTRRLAVAVAIMNSPSVILLDEPSNGLDPLGVVQMRDILTRLAKQECSFIVSSHRLDELEKTATKFLFLYRGKLIPPDEIDAAKAYGHRVLIRLDKEHLEQAARKLSEMKLNASIEDNLLAADVPNKNDVPDIVEAVVSCGGRITEVRLKENSLEDVFVKLFSGDN